MISIRSLRALHASRWHEGYYLGRSLVPHSPGHVRGAGANRRRAESTQRPAAAAVHAAPSTFISQWQPLTAADPLLPDKSAAESVNLLVIESFAGSYSAARTARLLNSMPASPAMPAVRVSAYAAIEVDEECYSKGPDSKALGIADPSRFLSINGSVTDAAVQGRVLNFVQRMLQQSEEAHAAAAGAKSISRKAASQQQRQQQLQQQRIDGILFVGGPPCTFYSLANNANAPGIAREPELYKQRLYESDQIVQAFLAMYSACKALAASSSTAAAAPAQRKTSSAGGQANQAGQAAAAAACRKPVATCIVMENPWSADLLRIKYPQEGKRRGKLQQLPPAAAAAAAGLVEAAAGVGSGSSSGRMREHVHWGLRVRRFLAHELQKNGGPLAVTHHNWCSYGHISHPWKSTAIFSDLASLSDAHCICSQCQPKGRRLTGRLKHQVTVEGQRDSSTRAVWPDGFMLRVAWLFAEAARRE